MLADADAERGPLPSRQTRFDHRAQEARSQEREREGVRHVAFGAVLTISDLVASRSAFAPRSLRTETRFLVGDCVVMAREETVWLT